MPHNFMEKRDHVLLGQCVSTKTNVFPFNGAWRLIQGESEGFVVLVKSILLVIWIEMLVYVIQSS